MTSPERSVAIGPEMPDWGSWEWVGADVARELAKYYPTATYPPGVMPDADVVVVVKHRPPAAWMETVRRRARDSWTITRSWRGATWISSAPATTRATSRS